MTKFKDIIELLSASEEIKLYDNERPTFTNPVFVGTCPYLKKFHSNIVMKYGEIEVFQLIPYENVLVVILRG